MRFIKHILLCFLQILTHPLGAAGVSVMRFLLVIPVMIQVLFRGPFGLMSGDTSCGVMSVTTLNYIQDFFRRFGSIGEAFEELI